jgi:hypothetical protein
MVAVSGHRLARRAVRAAPGPPITPLCSDHRAHARPGHRRERRDLRSCQQPALSPLPVADPHRLVTISSDVVIARGYPAGFGWSFVMWEELQPHVPLFDGAIAWTPARFDLARRGERQPVEGCSPVAGISRRSACRRFSAARLLRQTIALEAVQRARSPQSATASDSGASAEPRASSVDRLSWTPSRSRSSA